MTTKVVPYESVLISKVAQCIQDELQNCRTGTHSSPTVTSITHGAGPAIFAILVAVALVLSKKLQELQDRPQQLLPLHTVPVLQYLRFWSHAGAGF